MTIDELASLNGQVPDEVTVEDKTLLEQVKLIQEPEKKQKI